MKKLVKTLVVCGFVLAFAATAAFGTTYTVTVDERGNGVIDGLTAGPTPIPASLSVDPVSGLTGLFYDVEFLAASLGFSVTPGDVVLSEPGALPPSDLIRFTNTGVQQGLFFFSLQDDLSPPDLADVPQLPLFSEVVTFAETGPEGQNGFFYVPAPQGPGDIPQAQGLVGYNFISDVPEPSTMALACFAAAGLAVASLRRRRPA
jgi:hypothetical protein